MSDLEAAMAKALEGKFFWEPTSGDEPMTSGDVYRIRVAQRKFYKPKTKTPDEIRSEDLARLGEIIDRRRGTVAQVGEVNYLDPKEMEQFSRDVASVIAEVHGVDVHAIAGRSRGNRAAFAKHHYPWAMIRFFPLIPLRRLAVAIGKDRATLYHSDEVFTKRQDEFEDKIDAVDAVFGYA